MENDLEELPMIGREREHEVVIGAQLIALWSVLACLCLHRNTAGGCLVCLYHQLAGTEVGGMKARHCWGDMHEVGSSIIRCCMFVVCATMFEALLLQFCSLYYIV
jgi:hypothetical protein